MLNVLKSHAIRYSFLLLIMVLCNMAYGQGITGRVIDSASSSPISNASVYLNGSSFGTTTGKDGSFALPAKGGNIPLIISCIGYESVTIAKYGSEPLTIRLASRPVVLKEVTINAGGMSREAQLAIFLREFLGTPADGCSIANTDDLNFRYSKKAGRFSATADRPLQITNKRLGYKVTYFLKAFLYTDSVVSIKGTYFFADDTAGLKPSDVRKIMKSRENAYFGSKMHFIRSLWEDNLKKNKFELYNGLYGRKDVIPVNSAVTTHQNQKYLTYKQPIYVVYRNNNNRATVLSMPQGMAAGIIDRDGFYEPDFYWSGEMAGQRMAQLLPFEYHPSGQAQTSLVNEQLTKQPLFDSLLNLYAARHSSPVLFMHFDKNVYSNNENVWFTGYLVEGVDNSKYKTLSLALIKDDDRSVLMDDRFVIANGFCFGNTNIPDSVRAGAYTFIAYGNRLENGLPDIVFTQQITVKNETQQIFNASLNPLDTSATAVNQKVMLLVNFMDAKSAPNSVPVTYYIGDARKPVTTGAVKTALGQYIFNIPLNTLSAVNNKLHVQVKYKTDMQDLSIALPVPPQPAQVRFYPEGGNLTNGVSNAIGWEAKSATGVPVYTDAVLYEDAQPLDTINTNSSGMGRFLIIPQKNKKYSLKLSAGGKTTSYDLPEAVDAPSLTVRHAVVNDTLVVDVYNDNPQQKIYLLGHDYNQIFFEVPVERRPNQRVRVILNNVPRGLLQLTLVDSAGRPFAERLAFAHYINKSKLALSADNTSYGTRKKVKLSIELNGEATAGAVSVAVVQENRVEIKNKNDIENYFYLKYNLGSLPLKENYFSNVDFDRRDLDDVLLIKGWSRYKWTDALKTRAEDTVQHVKELAFAGRVSKYSGKFKEPVSLVTFSPPHTYDTDINGSFILPDSDIVHEPGKKVTAMVAKDVPSDYKIQIINPYDSLNKQMASRIDPVLYAGAQESTLALQVPGTERAIHLKEVTIKDKKDEFFHKSDRLEIFGTNGCNDYVCRFNILNCPNHKFEADNMPAIVGMMYNGRIYMGCPTGIPFAKRDQSISFKGIYAAQEFYPADYSQVSPSQPDYVSTLYWKNQLLLKKGAAQELSFYTGDITGTFKVIVQGVTDNDVIYGETSFRVKK